MLVSHGSGSSPLLFNGLMKRLATEGYFVAAVEHPGNHRQDDRLAGSEENLVNRPRHLRVALDALAANPELGPQLRAERVAVLGQSLGGYTALAAAGGTPWSREGTPLATVPDPRVAALVLLTPAVFWFVPNGSLADVRVPILVYVGEEDTLCPPWHGHLVHGYVPDRTKVTLRVVPAAGHLSFLDELPPGAPWRDPPGFDRPGVHARMQDEIVAFLGSAIGD